MKNNQKVATFGGGCFWCTEAVFRRLDGVSSVVSGYAGGTADEANYRDVCDGTTDHAEAIEITFDPEIISFETLVHVHLTTHDPTTLNQQGADRGTQYRSVIFYHNEQQKNIARFVIKELATEFDNPIVTTLEPYEEFFVAEKNHQEYYERNETARYCQIVIVPKIQKLEESWAHLLKDD